MLRFSVFWDNKHIRNDCPAYKKRSVHHCKERYSKNHGSDGMSPTAIQRPTKV
ncbi:hypothetical protein PM93P1_00001 [Parabacteroides phage PM93P1]|nr:hypothetical protein PM93P1_00001 [Parabacteroides phage PM93P1]